MQTPSTPTVVSGHQAEKYASHVFSDSVMTWRARIRGTAMLLNATDAALYLGVSRSKFYKWLDEGRIKPSLLDKRRYSVAALDSVSV
jgi:excisionase family DNA binding protein